MKHLEALTRPPLMARKRPGRCRPALPGCLLALAMAAAGSVAAQTVQDTAPQTPRGRLLYENHCIGCHTAQVHWRDARQARDWPGLKGWVGRWQSDLGLGWSEHDITEVARHLNDRYYHYRQTSDRVGQAAPHRPGPVDEGTYSTAE